MDGFSRIRRKQHGNLFVEVGQVGVDIFFGTFEFYVMSRFQVRPQKGLIEVLASAVLGEGVQECRRKTSRR